MPFTNPDFPGQIFRTVEEWEDARKKRREVEDKIEARRQNPPASRVVATLVPLSTAEVGRKLTSLELQVRQLQAQLREAASDSRNAEGIVIGTILFGESKGRSFSLEVLEEGYLCSDGQIYSSLSGAALGVSGNRRSGWRFWRDHKGVPVGELSGRFGTHDHGSQQRSAQVSGL